MRYITIPSPRAFGANSASLTDLLAQLITNAPQWRDEWADQWDEAMIAVEALASAAVGAVVGITDEVHERFATLLKTATIQPSLLTVIMPLIHAITKAPAAKPEEK